MPSIDDAEDYTEALAAMAQVGMTPEEEKEVLSPPVSTIFLLFAGDVVWSTQMLLLLHFVHMQVWKVTSGILHILNVGFDAAGEGSSVKSSSEVGSCCCRRCPFP